MCGIAGILGFDHRPINRARLDAMLNRITHRGGDDQAITILDHCALAHARLSIIDPANGAQPMHATPRDNHGQLHVIFNGEIYNHRQLRTQLESCGHRFTSDHSDTEVLLHGYRQWGKKLPNHLNGMFALAIWDQDQRELFLARDPAGKKPLYFNLRENELVFASLINAVVAGVQKDFRPAVNRHALINFLQLGYTFNTSMLEGIEELPAGSCMTVCADGSREVECYDQHPANQPRNPSDDLQYIIDDAVNARLEADVPLGCFISGGIDSSLIAAVAQQQLRSRGSDRLRTFNVAMPDLKYDESSYAQAVAKHLGTEHTTLAAQQADVFADLRHLMSLTGEPTADSSLLPTYWLCRAARAHVKVALSGDGGDELFGGYDRYRALRWLQQHRWWLRFLPDGVLGNTHPKSKRARLGRLVSAAQVGSDPRQQYMRMIHLFTPRQIGELAPDDAHNAPDMPLSDWPRMDDSAMAALRWDYAHYLRFDILRKVDRASMAVALEVRCPLLDKHVRDFAWSMNCKALMPSGQPKALLRNLAEQKLPRAITRRPKQGFAVPIGAWFRGRLKDELADNLFDGTLESLGLATKPARQIFEQHTTNQADHSHRLFALLQLAMWQRWRKAQVS